MTDLSHDEREYLIGLLRNAHDQLLHELHRAVSYQFKNILRERIEMNERITAHIAVEAETFAI